MSVFKPIKVTSLPATPAPDAVYYVKGSTASRVKVYVTDSTGTAYPVGEIVESPFSPVNSAVVAGDTFQQISEKLQGQISNISSNYLQLSGGTMTGYITLHADPTQAFHAATKQYVDSVAEGLHIHAAVQVATNGTLASLSGGTVTYNNGSSGVGATLTLSVALTQIDGYSLVNGDRVLVKNEANKAHNGIYVRTSSTVFTRALDYDTTVEIKSGDFVFVSNGTIGGKTGWVQILTVTTIGTSNIEWQQFSGAGTYVGSTSIILNGNSFERAALTGDVTATQNSNTLTLANSGVVAGTYNNVATQVRPFTVDSKGRITAIGTAVTITPAWSSITGTPTTLAGYGITDAVPSSRTITINGTALDLSANRSWSVGTVTSVGLSLPSIFTVSNSPVTGSGTLTATLATQTANTIFAGPTTGVAASPTFRGLVSDDIPTLAITSKVSATSWRVFYSNSTGVITELALGAAGTYLRSAGATSAPTFGTIAGSEVTGAALTATNDTNITLTLGGTPATALLRAASITVGWTGTLAVGRGGTGTSTAFTTGSVVFAAASGVYSQDNSNFFWDNTNKRLGIGISSPTARLHLAASATGAASLRIVAGVAPTSPNIGDVYYDSSLNRLRWRSDSQWIDAGMYWSETQW